MRNTVINNKKKIGNGGRGRTRTYVVSNVTGLQPADFATSHTLP